MASVGNSSAAAQIVEGVGGSRNIASFTHCATRLRFQLRDGSVVDGDALDKTPGVLGTVPQAGDRYQVVIGGAVESVYNDIAALPEMRNVSHGEGDEDGAQSDADVKAAARAGGPRGRFAWLDNFFEFLSDSFRPIIGALLGASLFITFMALMGTLGVIGNWADPRTQLPIGWQFVNLMWQCVFYFLPLMVAYNASKKVGADPWVGFAVMAVLLLPGFSAFLKDPSIATTTIAGTQVQTINVFGIPLALRDYGSQVFPPLLMAGVLGPLTKLLKRLIPQNVQLIFVPFLSMLIMIPLTAFIIGPIGVFAGAGLAGVLKAVNDFSPLIFAIVIPLAYPFMVPLGLHWPINAIMLLNIQQLGYDYIQGPMGAWNFACFGATAGVLVLASRKKEKAMQQTALGALAAGLLGGISEPSLYGIHLRYKRIYPRMLIGCLAGGITMGVGSMLLNLPHGIETKAFVFTSLLTIPAFSNAIPLYALAVGIAFVVSMVLVMFSGYEDKPAKGELATAGAAAAPAVVAAGAGTPAARAEAASSGSTVAAANQTEGQTLVGSPVAGYVVGLDDVPDKVFASRALGEGVGVRPTSGSVCSPVAGELKTVPASGHAFGIKTDDGVEVLVHVGIDTVRLKGEHFDVLVAKGDRVEAGQPLVNVDMAAVREAGYDTTTIVVITNTKALGSVTPITGQDVAVGEPIIDIAR